MDKPVYLLIILLFSSLGYIAADLYLPSLPAIATDFSVDITQSQLSVSAYMLFFALSQWVYGPLSDAIGRRKPLLFGISLLLVGSVICAVAPSIMWVIVGRAVQGAGAGSVITLSRAILRDLYSGTRLAQFGSYLAACGVLVISFAPLLGGVIQHYLHWRISFTFIAVYTAVTILVIVFKFPETNQHQSKHLLSRKQWKIHLKTIFQNKVFIAMSVIVFMTYAGILAWLTAGPALLQVQLGLSPIAFGWAATAMGLSYMAGGVINAQCVNRQGIQTMLVFGLLSMLVGSGIMLCFGIYLKHITLWLIMIPMGLFSLGSGLVFANAYATALNPFPKIAGITSSIFGFVQMAGGAVSSALIAYSHEATQAPLAFILFIASIISAVSFFKVKDLL